MPYSVHLRVQNDAWEVHTSKYPHYAHIGTVGTYRGHPALYISPVYCMLLYAWDTVHMHNRGRCTYAAYAAYALFGGIQSIYRHPALCIRSYTPIERHILPTSACSMDVIWCIWSIHCILCIGPICSILAYYIGKHTLYMPYTSLYTHIVDMQHMQHMDVLVEYSTCCTCSMHLTGGYMDMSRTVGLYRTLQRAVCPNIHICTIIGIPGGIHLHTHVACILPSCKS